jgi:hypothetical protein
MVSVRGTRLVVLGGALVLAAGACSNLSRLDDFTFADVCVPEALETTCKGVECGPRTNNCGEPVECPDTCPTQGNGTETCGDNPEQDPNRCGCIADPQNPLKCCVPDAFEKVCLGIQCGPRTDNCGQVVMCPDSCQAPYSCGDNATKDPNQCGCTSPTEAETCATVACGSVKDRCGAKVDCPSTCKPLQVCAIGGAPENTCGCTGAPMAIPEAPLGCEKVLGTAEAGNLGRAYYLCAADSYDAARAFCQSFGTDVTRPKSLAVLDFLTDAIDQSLVADTWLEWGSYWIGLEDPACKAGACNYAWIDGTPLTATFYNYGEPNNTGGGEHCVEAKTYTGWNDIPCSNSRGVVCETTCN